MAEAKGKDRVGKAEFEYRRNRTGRTRYELSRAEANADELAREKSDALTGDVETVGMKAPTVAAPAAKAGAKARRNPSNADEKTAKARTKA